MTIATTMDHLEPERCRRTDGRKWRCKNNVVPHKKYCERHMHRGCSSSRKIVEMRRLVSNRRCFLNSHVPIDLGDGKFDLDHDDALSTDSTGNGVECCKDITDSEIAIARTICPSNDSVARNDEHKGLLVLSPGFGLSRLNACNEREGKLNQDSGLMNNFAKTEPQSCRRTDGKKWQCKKIALPDKKYCEAHMNRGAKSKRILDQESSHHAYVTTYSSCSSRAATKSCDDNVINLNAMPPMNLREDEGNNDPYCNSMSEVTNITDEKS